MPGRAGDACVRSGGVGRPGDDHCLGVGPQQLLELLIAQHGAVIHPKHRILPLLRGHFCSRLPDESFLIYDAAHGTALLHRDGQVRYLAMERYIPGTDETELDWQRMWKRFFKALTIEQRRDEKAQMNHVPKRFWQDMCEMQADLL